MTRVPICKNGQYSRRIVEIKHHIKLTLAVVILISQLLFLHCVSAKGSKTLDRPSSSMGLSRLIQPDDLPGATGFADPYVFKEGEKWYITSTYSAKSPMYMVSTVDFRNIERHTLNLDLNESYLRKHVNNPDLIARHIWGFVP